MMATAGPAVVADASPAKATRSPWSALEVVAAVAMATGLYAFAFWVLWHSLLTDAFGRPPLDAVIKDFYLGDQYAYLGIAANVEEGRPAFVEPYTASGSSIYPSGYFWLLGVVARVTGTNAIAAWNAVGMAVDLALCGVVGAVGWVLTRSRWAWVLGPIPLVVGTFQHWTDGTWRAIHGAHAVLWPATASLFSPGAEPAALLCCLLALGLLTVAPSQEGRRRLAVAAGAGALVGVTLSIHTYVAMFTATAAAGWFLVRTCEVAAGPGRRRLALHLLVTAVAVALIPASIPVLRLGIVVAGAVAAVVWDRRARREVGPAAAAFGIAAGALAAPMLLRMASQLGDRSSFLYQRQASGVATDLSLPVGPVLLHSLPALILAAGCLLTLGRSGGDDGAAVGWRAAVVATVLSSGLLVFNESWGLQQEPYRFLPYGQFVVAAVALPFLVLPHRRRPSALALRTAAVVVVGLTIPTTLQFARETPAIVQFPEAERTAMKAAAAALPPDGLGLIDACVPKGAFKALTGARVVGLNAGLAYPADRAAVQTVLAEQAAGVVADGGALDRAEVTSFVTMRECTGSAAAALEERFGPATARIRFVAPPACGAPEPELELVVYRRARGEAGPAVRLDVPPEAATSPAHPFAPCALSSRRRDVA